MEFVKVKVGSSVVCSFPSLLQSWVRGEALFLSIDTNIICLKDELPSNMSILWRYVYHTFWISVYSSIGMLLVVTIIGLAPS